MLIIVVGILPFSNEPTSELFLQCSPTFSFLVGFKALELEFQLRRLAEVADIVLVDVLFPRICNPPKDSHKFGIEVLNALNRLLVGPFDCNQVLQPKA